ncbi:unnamed protein product [Orchesella dallaii]|uniref:F-box domain-containing protein n=1 Tax=Orchesella dallaii TaxID=48710 RepID=A0ABP1QK65_9HEXA
MARKSNSGQAGCQSATTLYPAPYEEEATSSFDKFPQEILQKIMGMLDEDLTQLLACRQVSSSWMLAEDSLLRFSILKNWVTPNNRVANIMPTLWLTMESQDPSHEGYTLTGYCPSGINISKENFCPTSSLRIKGVIKSGKELSHHKEVIVDSLLTSFSSSLSALSIDHVSIFPNMLIQILRRVPHLQALELSHVRLKGEITNPLPSLPDLTFLKLRRIKSQLKRDASDYFFGYITNQLMELQLDGVNYPALGRKGKDGPIDYDSIRRLKKLVITTPKKTFLQDTPSVWLTKLSVISMSPIDEITREELLSFLGKFSQSLVELYLDTSWLCNEAVNKSIVGTPFQTFNNLRKLTVSYPEKDANAVAMIRRLMQSFVVLEALHFQYYIISESDKDMDVDFVQKNMIRFLYRECYWNICSKLVSIYGNLRISGSLQGKRILIKSKIWEKPI